MIKTKLTLLLLCFCTSVFSESYVVTDYTKEGKLVSTVFKRLGNEFLVKKRLGEVEFNQGLSILFEKGDLLILGMSFDPVEGIESLKGIEGMEIHYIDKRLRKYYPTNLTRRGITWLDSGEVSPNKVQDIVIISD